MAIGLDYHANRQHQAKLLLTIGLYPMTCLHAMPNEAAICNPSLGCNMIWAMIWLETKLHHLLKIEGKHNAMADNLLYCV